MDIVKFTAIGKDVMKVVYRVAVVGLAVADRRETINKLCKDVMNAPQGKQTK